MLYEIENRVFEMFPAFRRGVVIAADINNALGDPAIDQLLSAAIANVTINASEKERERIAVWNDAYRRLGIDPLQVTPSISFLLNQIRRGKPPRSINTLVNIFNALSVKWIMPCGGDDLAPINGDDLRLGFARGSETFSPLFKPTVVENPLAGELIYYTPQTGKVLCRRWTWRNSDFSKLTTGTRTAAINLDFMKPLFTDKDIEAAVDELSDLVKQSCGKVVKSQILSPTIPCFEFNV